MFQGQFGPRSGVAALVALGLLAALPEHGWAQSADEAGRASDEKSAESARAGMFLPFTIAPRTDSQRAFAFALGGYDVARKSSQLEGTADVTLIGPLAARVGVLYGQTQNTLRPSAGLRVQAMSQANYGIDMGFGAFYRPEGFTEAEGEIEVVAAFGRRFGRLGLFANLVYGQDPEAAERDGEARLSGLYAFGARFQTGLETRLRLDLGSQPGKRRAGEADYDFIAGPVVMYALVGNVALIAQAGVSVLGLPQQSTRVGPIALGGLGGSL